MNKSMDDAGCCLLSVSWNVAKVIQFRSGDVSREAEIRRTVADVCRTAGLGAREWAETHGTGAETEYRPFLQLADVAYEINTLLLLVGDFLVRDRERSHRRWAEVETLMCRLIELVDETSVFLRTSEGSGLVSGKCR